MESLEVEVCFDTHATLCGSGRGPTSGRSTRHITCAGIVAVHTYHQRLKTFKLPFVLRRQVLCGSGHGCGQLNLRIFSQPSKFGEVLTQLH